MAWRGGRCLAALYLETAAGLRQRSVRKEEALAMSAFEKMKTVGDTQQFDPALEFSRYQLQINLTGYALSFPWQLPYRI